MLQPISVYGEDIPQPSSLYSKYCALIDGDSGRLLYGKASDEEVPMASTTKIMTCYLALTKFDIKSTVTTSSYAASMPDVQLNATTGTQFSLEDLLYSLMLKSHNDSAVIIAENCAFFYLCQLFSERAIAAESENPLPSTVFADFPDDLSFLTDAMLLSKDSSCLKAFSPEESKILVHIFADLMNTQAKDWGCTKTYYITPNGLDAEDEVGVHHTTAYELALIMSHCIDNPDFNHICQTKSYSFSDLTGRYHYSFGNANAFLNMYDHIVAGKTGFTGNAGYCYVCAYEADGRTFVVALLACGWPSNKTYKWKDTRQLLNFGREYFYREEILTPQLLDKTVSVSNGMTDFVAVAYDQSYSCLLSREDVVNVRYSIPEQVNAPVVKGELAGTVSVYINDALTTQIPVYFTSSIKRITYFDKLSEILNVFFIT